MPQAAQDASHADERARASSLGKQSCSTKAAPKAEPIALGATDRFKLRCAKVHATEEWAATFALTLEQRGVLAAFILAFTIPNMFDLDKDDWDSHTLFKTTGLLAVATSLNLFSVLVMLTMAIKTQRLIAKSKSVTPPTDCLDWGVEMNALWCANANPGCWFSHRVNPDQPRDSELTFTYEPDMSSKFSHTPTAVAYRWLCTGIVSRTDITEEEYNAKKRVCDPRELAVIATNAFILTLVFYLVAIAIRLVDVYGVSTGLPMATVLCVGVIATLAFMRHMGLDDLD